jgi:hypothetical protein
MDMGSTPVRSALMDDSFLRGKVKDGLAGIEHAHRDYIDETVRTAFADSLDLDKALRAKHGQENRWDYLLGHADSGRVVGLEPHSAKADEISTVIKKKVKAKEQLQSHLRPGVRIAAWLWVASGKVHFANTERARVRLDQNGIRFVGTRVMRKHLPGSAA